MKSKKAKPHIFLYSVFFVLGFTLVFSSIGVLLQTLLSRFSYATDLLRIIGGTIIIAMGTLFLVRMKYRIPFLGSRHEIKVRRFRNNYISSFVFGMAFAVGWTPCVGFIAGALYGLAATSPLSAFTLLFSFSLGLGMPFLVAGIFTSRFIGFLERSKDMLMYINIIGGLMLIALGLLIVTNDLIWIMVTLFGSNIGVTVPGEANIAIAFGAGLLTFFSPCILPVLSAFLSFVIGSSAGARKD